MVVVEGEVVALEVAGGQLRGVRLASGEVIAREIVSVAPRFAARSALVAALGVEVADYPSGIGVHVVADASGRTSVPGIWVAGNVSDLSAQVVNSAAAGNLAAAAINADRRTGDTSPGQDRARCHRFVTEEVRRAVATGGATLRESVSG